MRLFAIIALVFVTGCGTIEGAGKDLTSAGKAVSKAAKSARDSF